MLAKFLLCLIPISTIGVGTQLPGERGLSGGYNYNRCDQTYGPTSWPGSCPNQVSGTPINLCGAVAFPAPQPAITVTGYNVARTMNIASDGSSVTVTVVGNAPTLQVGNLSALVSRGTNSSSQVWNLQQMHLHWGRTGQQNSEGSEHYLQGQAFAAEAHFVHYNSRFADFTTAVGSGAPDALLVVGIFLKAGNSDDSATIAAMATAVTSVTKTSTPMTSSVTLSDLFDGTGTFYSYGGSLTTPTCLEIVTWIVMSTPKSVSMSSLAKIWQYSVSPGTSGADSIAKYGNYRPLQPVSGRTVYNSAGATAACSSVTEPSYNCKAASSAALLPSFSLSMHIAALVTFFACIA